MLAMSIDTLVISAFAFPDRLPKLFPLKFGKLSVCAEHERRRPCCR